MIDFFDHIFQPTCCSLIARVNCQRTRIKQPAW